MYINDPLVDWVRDQEQKDPEPMRRVESCIRKLKGVHPGIIMIEDLALNSKVKLEKSLPALSNMIYKACGTVGRVQGRSEGQSQGECLGQGQGQGQGQGRGERRSHTKEEVQPKSKGARSKNDVNMNNSTENAIENGNEEYLSVEEQVDALVNLAVDPNISVRQWVGLAMWI